MDAEGPPPLAAHLKTGTQKAHKDAESVAFVRAFLKGKIEISVYRQLVANLYVTPPV